MASIAFTLSRDSIYVPSFISPALYLISGVVLWSFSPSLSRILAKRNDGKFDLSGVTHEQLYATTFIGLGTYFALDSFANVFGWIHFFIVNKSPDYDFHQNVHEISYYDLIESGLTLLASFALIFAAQNFARKLARSVRPD